MSLARDAQRQDRPLTINEIASQVGLSWKATEGALRDAGYDLTEARLAKRQATKERNREIALRFTRGETVNQLAAAYGVSKQRISQIVRKDKE